MHLPSTVQTLDVPVFQTQAQSFHTEVAMTDAVIRELTSRTSLHVVTTNASGEADATSRERAFGNRYAAYIQFDDGPILQLLVTLGLKWC